MENNALSTGDGMMDQFDADGANAGVPFVSLFIHVSHSYVSCVVSCSFYRFELIYYYIFSRLI